MQGKLVFSPQNPIVGQQSGVSFSILDWEREL